MEVELKAVITGGRGFIGRALVRQLAKDGHDVVLLTRRPARTEKDTSVRVTYEQWDGQSVGPWKKHIDGADAVFNLAGEPIGAKRWSAAQKRRILDSRIGATKSVVGAIRSASRKPPVLVNASAVGYYGYVAEDEVTEDYKCGSGFLSNAVMQWEHEAAKAADHAVRVVLVRFGVVLAREGGALERMLVPFNLFAGGSLGSGKQWFPWVHLDDAVRAALHGVSHPSLSGPVNVAAPHSVRMREFCQALGKALHRPSWLPVPGFVLKTALGEMSDMILTGQRVVPRRLEQTGFRFSFPRLEQALSNIFGSP